MRGVPRPLAAVLLAVATLVGAAPPAARATFPERNGVLAVSGDGFELGRCFERISVVRPDGTALRKLTTGRGCGPERFGADWSADGRYVVFANGSWPLGIMAADGSRARRIPFQRDGSIGAVLEPP